jgi:hypothetical protein
VTSRSQARLSGSCAKGANRRARCEIMHHRSLGSRVRVRGCANARLCATGDPCPCTASMMVVMVVSISLFDGRAPTQPRMDGSGPRDGCASIAFPQQLSRFFSLPRSGGIPRGKQKSRLTPSSAALRA